MHITFILSNQTCATVQMGHVDLPQKNEVKYLGWLTWAKHDKSNRKQLNLKAKQINWLLGRRSKLSTESKILLYKAAVKPTCTFGILLWGKASNSNFETLQRFQSSTLRFILNAPWYINNHRIHEDLKINTVLSELNKWNSKYLRKSENHTNALAVNLLDNYETTHRLKRYTHLTLPERPE
jgi:hypothetical protein